MFLVVYAVTSNVFHLFHGFRTFSFLDQIPNANWSFAVGSVDQAKIEFSKTEAGHIIDSVRATVYHMRNIMSTGLY